MEAVINPATTTMFPRNKTHYLNILHAGWPGGLVLGGILAISMSSIEGDHIWRYKIGLFLIPTVIYGVMLLGQKWPVQERVAARISYREMLQEFGWGSCLIVAFFAAKALDEITRNLFEFALPMLVIILVTVIPTLILMFTLRSFGRPMFMFLLLVMVLLATTELGTDSWIASLMTPVLRAFGENAGNWVLVYTSFIMFVLRFFAGPIVHRINPLGLLACSAGIAAIGLLWLANSGSAALAVFLAATLYGLGKTYFWPTTLGVVSEQFPKGGALTLNAIAGLGMISVGVLGNPFLGVLQDKSLDDALHAQNPALQCPARPSRRTEVPDEVPASGQAEDRGAVGRAAGRGRTGRGDDESGDPGARGYSSRHHVFLLPGSDLLFPVEGRLQGSRTVEGELKIEN